MTKDWTQTYWSDGDNTVTIQEVLSVLYNHPIVSIPLCDLSHIPSTEIDLVRKENSDLSFPIIVLEMNGLYNMILDGHHRRQKAIEKGKTHILAKILKVLEIENHG